MLVNTLPVVQGMTPRRGCQKCELLVMLMLPFFTEAGPTAGDPGRDRLRYVPQTLNVALRSARPLVDVTRTGRH